MDNGFNGGIQNISAMNMGIQGKNPKQEKRGGRRIKSGMLLPAVIGAAVILLIFIFLIAGTSDKRKVKNVLKEYLTNDLDELKWDKWYPDEMAEGMEDIMEEYGGEDYGEGNYKPYDSVDILAVSKVNIKEYESLLQNMVLNTADMFGVDMDKKDINITKAYMLFCNAEAGKEVEFVGPFVIKVNGKYGVYGYTQSDNFEGASLGRTDLFGTYVLYQAGGNDYTFNYEDFEQAYGNGINVYLIIDSDGSFELNLKDVGGDMARGSWEFSGDDFILATAGGNMMGTYQEGVITIFLEDNYLSFKK